MMRIRFECFGCAFEGHGGQINGSYHVCVTLGVSRALGAFLSVLEYVSREPGMSGAACGEGVFLFRRGEGGD